MKALQAYPLAIFLATTVALCSAAPLLQPAPVYGPPPGAYQRYQQARAAPAPAPFRPQENTFNPGLTPPPPPPQGQQGVQGYQQQRAAPAAPQRQLGYQRDAPPAQQGYPQSYFRQQPLQQQQQFQQPHFQQLHFQQPQQLQRLQPQPQPQQQQQFRTELQGVWRYTVPVRPPPLREDQVPFQGLGATDSVTMPEQAPYDPLLVTGPAAEHFVRSLTDREPHFYPAFPHTRLVLGNQQKRLDNGLPANRLGSIRTSSDFYRGE